MAMTSAELFEYTQVIGTERFLKHVIASHNGLSPEVIVTFRLQESYERCLHISEDEFLKFCQHLFTEEQLKDLNSMARAEFDQVLLTDERISQEWLTNAENIFKQLDFSDCKRLGLPSVALLGCAANVLSSTKNSLSWISALQTAMEFLPQDSMSRCALKVFLRKHEADASGLAIMASLLQGISSQWRLSGFGGKDVCSLAINSVENTDQTKEIEPQLKAELQLFLHQNLHSLMLCNLRRSFTRHHFPLSLSVHILKAFSASHNYIRKYEGAEEVLMDPVMRYISTAVVNLEIIGHELLEVLQSTRASQPNLPLELLEPANTLLWIEVPFKKGYSK